MQVKLLHKHATQQRVFIETSTDIQTIAFPLRPNFLLHIEASGHSEQRGFLSVQYCRPREIRLTCSENLSFAGIFSCNRFMSRCLHTPSLEVGRIHPNRRQILQQWVSTGKTSRPSEYINTHRATFVPTPGRFVRKASHWSSRIRFRGANVILPNAALTRRQISRILLDLVAERPPDFSGIAMAPALADAKLLRRGNCSGLFD